MHGYGTWCTVPTDCKTPTHHSRSCSSAPALMPRRERGSRGCESTRRMHSNSRRWKRVGNAALGFNFPRSKGASSSSPPAGAHGCRRPGAGDRQWNRGREGGDSKSRAHMARGRAGTRHPPPEAEDHAKWRPLPARRALLLLQLERASLPAGAFPPCRRLRRPDMKVSLQRPVFRSWSAEKL